MVEQDRDRMSTDAISDRTPSLTVVVPVYNEIATLKDFLPSLENLCQANGWELILVNDGSTDGSAGLLASSEGHPGVTVIHHQLNRGYGGAVKSGLLAADTTHVVTMDSDGQHDLADLSPMYQFALEKNTDLLIGRRMEIVRAYRLREFAKWWIRFYTRLLLPLPIHDLNSGFKLYRTKLVQKYVGLCPNTIAFSDVITLSFVCQRKLVLEHPIHIHGRQAGKSAVNFLTTLDIAMNITYLGLLFNPLRIFFPLSALCLLFGFAWEARVLLLGLGSSVVAFLFGLTGLLIALLGLVSKQISSIRLSMLEDATRQNGTH